MVLELRTYAAVLSPPTRPSFLGRSEGVVLRQPLLRDWSGDPSTTPMLAHPDLTARQRRRPHVWTQAIVVHGYQDHAPTLARHRPSAASRQRPAPQIGVRYPRVRRDASRVNPGSGAGEVTLMSQSSSASASLHKDAVIGQGPIMIPPVRSRSKSPKFSGPPRVRHEPPTIEEAIAAAQDLALRLIRSSRWPSSQA